MKLEKFIKEVKKAKKRAEILNFLENERPGIGLVKVLSLKPQLEQPWFTNYYEYWDFKFNAFDSFFNFCNGFKSI